ncbi:hypothetical protein J3Q64DRAFT_1049788 [Phycomyces blakesleeanus]|uniref:Uncharacterized protein n=1 Tax=Phycomyces blakesleeanus TaxID=4837 RepID=A0ABR3BE73_PHYBL
MYWLDGIVVAVILANILSIVIIFVLKKKIEHGRYMLDIIINLTGCISIGWTTLAGCKTLISNQRTLYSDPETFISLDSGRV